MGAAQEPPPLWDIQIGGSFVGTSGNSETSTVGADFGLHRRWTFWQIESTAAAVRTSDQDVRTAERYLWMFRGRRTLTSRIGLSTGLKLERDRFAGIDFRSITDLGVTWALIDRPGWTLDGRTSVALNQEWPVDAPSRSSPIGVLQLLNRIPFGESGFTTQRFTFYPDFDEGEAHRAELELAAQAAMTERIALKVGYLVRRSNRPVAGFEKTDTMTTASVVMQWKAATPASTQ